MGKSQACFPCKGYLHAKIVIIKYWNTILHIVLHIFLVEIQEGKDRKIIHEYVNVSRLRSGEYDATFIGSQ